MAVWKCEHHSSSVIRRCATGKPAALLSALGMLFCGAILAVGQTAKDPGVRGGQPGAGRMLSGLTSTQQQFFSAGKSVFNQIVSVQGGTLVPGTRLGLGPIFNSNGCETCHSQPSSGGTSPLPSVANPEIAAGTANGATNVIPSFIVQGGPMMEARFVFQSDGVTPDGGVHDLFTIAGRTDGGSCAAQQPDFAGNLAKNNVIFRIPTPTFGTGLMENIEDVYLTNQAIAECTSTQFPGICGVPSVSGNGGTFNKFGWKAQNPSMIVFAGEASNVELGVTNELFTEERNDQGGCVLNTLPEDTMHFNQAVAAKVPSDTIQIAMFMRFLDQPTPAPSSPSTVNGKQQFINVGCAQCHNLAYTTGPSAITGLNNAQANLFSDLLLHHMGPGLADCVTQGTATGDMFRSAPLWGVGQRAFFLHDGRTQDIVQAVEDHMSTAGTAACGMSFGDSEANAVITNFNNLSSGNQQDLINFLRSL